MGDFRVFSYIASPDSILSGMEKVLKPLNLGVGEHFENTKVGKEILG